MSPVMERRTPDQDIVTGRIVDRSATPDKIGTIGLSGHDAAGYSRQPITHVYKSAGKSKPCIIHGGNLQHNHSGHSTTHLKIKSYTQW
jgi:hypothetical protein